MTEDSPQHSHLDGIADYSAALDTLCKRAQHTLYLFEKDYDGLGFNSELRYETLRHFLLASPTNYLYILAHDPYYLSTLCPRMTMLLRQFDSRMFIHRIAKNLQQATAPFCVADNAHYVRRFHFDDPRGLLAINDPSNARTLQSLFLEMWVNSHPALSTTRLGL